MMDEPPNETKNDSDAFSPASSPRTPASAPRIRSSAFHNTVPFSDPQIASYNSDSSPPLQHSPSTSSKNIHDEDVDVDVDETSRRGSSTARQFRHLHNVDDRLMSSLRQQGDVLMRSSKKRMKSADIRHYRSNSHTKKGSKKKKLKKTKDVARRSSISSRGVGGGDVLPSLSNASISLKLPHPVDECRSLTHNSTPPNSSSGINDLIAEFKTTTPRHREGESDASLFDALMMEKLAMDTSLSTRNRHHSADVSLRHHHHQHQEASPQRRGIVDETQEHHVQVDAAYAITSPEHSHSLLSSGASPLNPPTTSRPQPLKISSKPAKRYSEVVDDVRQHKKSTSISHHQHRQGRRSVSPYETPHSPTHTTTSASSTSAKVNAIGTKPTKKSKSSKPSGDTLPLGGSLNDVIARFDQLVAARQKRANENKKKLATGNIINNNTSSDSHGDARSPPAAQHSKRGTSSSSWNHHHGRRSPSTGAAVKRNSIQPVHDSSLHVMEKKSNNNNSSDNATAMSAPKDGGVRSTPRRRSSVAAAQVHHKPAPNASLADIQHFHDLLLHSATDADAKRKQKEQQQQQLRRSSTTRGMSLTTDDPRVAAPTNTNSSAPNHHRTRSSSDTSMMQSSSIAPGGTRARRSSHTVRFKTASLHEHTPTPKNDDDDDDDDVAFRSTSNPPQRTLPSEHDNGSDPATTRARRRRSSASAAARKRELAKKWRPTASATDVQDLLDHLLNSSKTAPKKNTTRVEVPPTQNEAEHATTDTRRRRSSASASRRPPRSQSAPTSRRDQTGENARTNAAHPSPSSTTTARRASAQRNHRHATPPATRSSNKHKNVTDVGPATRQNHQAKEQKKVEAPSTAKPLPTSPPPLQTDPSTSSILSQRALHAQTLRKEFMELHQHVDMPPTLEAVLSLHDYLNNEDRVAAAMADVGSQPTTSPVNANNVPTTSPRATTPPTNAAAKKKKKVSGDGHQVTDALPTTNNVISPRHPPDARNTHDADASAAPISSTSNTHKDSTAALLQQPFQPLRVKGDTTSSMTITTQHPSSSSSQSRRKHPSSSRRSRSNDSQVRTSDASQRGRGAQQTSARNHHRTSSANDVGPQSSRSNHKNHIKNAGPAHTDGPPNVDAADEVHHDGAPSRNRATNRTNVGERRRMEDNHVSDATSTTANTRSSIQDDSSTQRSANSARRSSRRGGSKTHTQLPVSASPVVEDDDGTPLSLLGGSTSEWLPARYPPNNKKKHYTAPPQQFDHGEDDVRRQHHHHQPSSRAARLNRASPSPHDNNDTTRILAQRPSAEAPWSLRAVPPLWIIHPRDNHASRRDDDDDEVHPMFYVVGGGLPTQACCTPRELIVQNNNSDDVLLLRRVEHQHGGDGRGATNKSDDDVFLDLLTGREWLVSPRDGPRSHRHTPTSAANDARVSAPRMIHLHSAANNISKHNAGTQTHVYASATTQTMAAHTSSSDQQPFMLLVPSHRNSSRDHPRTSRDGFFMFGDVPTYSTRTLDSVGTQTAREATSTIAVQTHFLEQRHTVGTSDAEVGVDAAPRRTEALLITPTEAGLCARRISINASHRTSASGSTHSPQTVRHPLPANASAFPSTQHHSFQDVALDDLHIQHPQEIFTNNGAQRPHQQQQHRFSFLTVDGGANTSPMMMSDERQIGANADVGRVAGYTNSPSLATQQQERAREEHSDDTRTSTSMMHSMATQTVRVEGGTYAWEEPSVSHPRVREHNPSTSTRRHVLEPRIPSATPSAVVRAMQQHTSSSAAMISVDRSPPSTANMMHQRVGAPPLGCSSVGTQHNQVADIHVLRTNQNMLMTMSSPNFRSSTEEGASARGTELSDVRQRPHVQQAVGISPPVSGRTTPHRPSPRAMSAQHNSSDHAHHDADVDVEEDHHDLITPRYHLNALPPRNIDDEDGSPHDASPLFVDPPHTHRRLQHNTHPRRTQKTRDDDQQLDLEHTFVEMRVWEQGNPPKHDNDDDAGAAVPSSAPQRRVTRRNKWGMPSLKKKKAPRSLAQRVERTWKRAMKRAATVATSGQPQNNKHRQSFSQMKMHGPTRGDDIEDAPASSTKQQPSRKLSEKWLGPPDSFVFPSPSAAAQHPRRGVHDHAHAHDTASRGAHPSSSSSPCVRRVDEDGRRPTPRAQRFAFLRRRRSAGRQRRVRRARRSPPRVSLVAQQHIYADQRVTGPRFVFLRRRWSAQRAYRHHAHTHTATQEHGGGKASDVPPPQRMQRRRKKKSEEEHPQRQSMHHDVVAATKPHTSTSSPAARTKIMADVDRHHHLKRKMDARPATHRLPRYTQPSRIKSSTAKWVQVQRSRSVRLPRAPSSRKRTITRYARRRTHQRAQQQQQQPSLHLQEPEASPYVPARPGSRKLRVRRYTRVRAPLMVRPNRAALLRAVHGKEARGPHDRCAVCHHHQLRHGDVHHHGNVARRKPSLKAAAAPPPKMKKHPSPSSPYTPARPGSRPLRAQRTHQHQQQQRHRAVSRSVTNSGRDRWCAACVRHDAITTTVKVLQRAEVASSPYTPTRPGSRRLRMKKNSSMQQRTSLPVHVRVPKNASTNGKQTHAAPIQKQHVPVSHGDAVARTTHASPQQTHSRRSQPFAPVAHTAPFVVGRMQRYAITPPESSPYVPARVGARTLRTQPRRKGHHRQDSEDQPQQHPTTTTTPHQKRTDDVGKNSSHMTKDGADAPPSATVNDDDALRAQRRWRSRRVRPLGMRALVRRWINVAPRVYQHLSTPPSPLLTSSAPRRTRSSPQRQKQEARKARRLHHDSRQPPQVDVDAPVKVPSSSPHLVDDDGVRSSRSNDPQQVVVPTTSSDADDDVLSSLSSTSRRSSNKDNGTIESVDALPLDDGVAVSHPHQDADEPLHDEHINATSPTTKEKRRVAAASAATHLLRRQHDVRRQSSRTHSSSPRRQLRLRQTHSRQQPNNNNKNRKKPSSKAQKNMWIPQHRVRQQHEQPWSVRRRRFRHRYLRRPPTPLLHRFAAYYETSTMARVHHRWMHHPRQDDSPRNVPLSNPKTRRKRHILHEERTRLRKELHRLRRVAHDRHSTQHPRMKLYITELRRGDGFSKQLRFVPYESAHTVVVAAPKGLHLRSSSPPKPARRVADEDDVHVAHHPGQELLHELPQPLTHHEQEHVFAGNISKELRRRAQRIRQVNTVDVRVDVHRRASLEKQHALQSLMQHLKYDGEDGRDDVDAHQQQQQQEETKKRREDLRARLATLQQRYANNLGCRYLMNETNSTENEMISGTST